MKRNTTSLMMGLLLVFSLVLSACSPAKAPEATKAPTEAVTEAATEAPKALKKDLKKVLLSPDWMPNTNHTGIYVALAKGYYEEAGIDLDIQDLPEGGPETLVAAGHAQFGISFQDMLAPAFAKDEPLPVTAVAALIAHNTSGIISLKEAGIDSPKDLEGKRYATWDMPVEQAVIKSVMESDGGDFDKLKLVPSTVTDAATGLQTDIDAIWIFYAWDGINTKLQGLETNYFHFKDVNPELDYYTPVLIANNDFLKEDPETAKAFLAATAKGYQAAMKDPKEAAKILSEAAPELNKDLVLASQEWLKDQYQADSAVWGQFDADRWDRFYKWLFKNELIEKEIPAGFGFSNDFLPTS